MEVLKKLEYACALLITSFANCIHVLFLQTSLLCVHPLPCPLWSHCLQTPLACKPRLSACFMQLVMEVLNKLEGAYTPTHHSLRTTHHSLLCSTSCCCSYSMQLVMEVLKKLEGAYALLITLSASYV
jgi:hypothetical protein